MAEHFEAKKHAWRQVQDGIVLSLVIHPNDLPKALALAPLGTRFMVAAAEIGDDEQPRSSEEERRTPNPEAEGSTPSGAAKLSDGEKRARAQGLADSREAVPKERRPLSSLPLSQQAAIRCTDQDFQTFLNGRVKVTYTTEDPHIPSEIAAEGVRTLCNVASRKDLDRGGIASAHWRSLEASYQSWLTDARYAQARR